ncbi:hypothetical protein A0J48_020825 [Sphaerospermopsis aphanizomenoides BCCUSP55]|uniref:hypothetical protein n=1 Tax=Sphaerospermopsis aphanizomenoides TaxID=459663 RepID=UPI0019083345|nr:hypothetical protein [Sphaerospermopsis aphanizomenoides]MBK1989945.1 hypothetical protein [Sphaerospermopsis aphanizomenoides BCCUSP55]
MRPYITGFEKLRLIFQDNEPRSPEVFPKGRHKEHEGKTDGESFSVSYAMLRSHPINLFFLTFDF